MSIYLLGLKYILNIFEEIKEIDGTGNGRFQRCLVAEEISGACKRQRRNGQTYHEERKELRN